MKNGEFPDGQVHPAGQDRPGQRQLQYAGPGALPDQPPAPSPHRGTSGASIPCTTSPTPLRTRWRASPTPSAPWSLRTTGPSTTGWWSTATCPAKPRQIEFARLGINYTVHVQAQAPPAGGGGAGLRLGRSPDAHPLRPAPPGLYAPVHPELLRAHRRGKGGLHVWNTPSWSTACGRT